MKILCIRNEYEYKIKINQLNNDWKVKQHFTIKKNLPKLGLYYFVYVNPTKEYLDRYMILRRNQERQAEKERKERLAKERQIIENVQTLEDLCDSEDIPNDISDDVFDDELIELNEK